MKTSMVHALEKELRLKTKKLKALTRERTREKEMKEQVAVADRAIENVRKEQRKTVTLSNIEQIKARRKSSAVARGERRKMQAVQSSGGGAKDRTKNKGALPLVERVAEEVYDERHEYLSKTMHRGVEGEGGVKGLPSLEAEYSHRDRLTQAYERLRERNLQQGAFSNTL